VPHRLPVVLTRVEVSRLLQALNDPFWLIAALLYGAGLRLNECLELRVKDLDFERSQITVRRGKGGKDRMTMLPQGVQARLSDHLRRVRDVHTRDVNAGFGRVVLPDALARKYPNADREWRWQFVFPAARICRDPRWGPPSRFHLHESAVQRAIADAARRLDLTKRVGPHALRSVSA
jgi:integrase